MLNQKPHPDGDDRKGSAGGSPQPSGPAPANMVPSAEIPKSDFIALVAALRHQPAPVSYAVSLCADNFAISATAALAYGTLTPDQVLECLPLRNPTTGELVFKEEQLLDPLIIAVSEAVKNRISAAHKAACEPGLPMPTASYAISHTALAALATFVAEERGIGLKARLAAYEAIVVGSTRTIQFGNSRRESSEFIASISRFLQLKPEDFKYETAALVKGIGGIPTHGFFAHPVDTLLVNLSRPGANGIPANVQMAALGAIGERCDLYENLDKDGKRVGTAFTRESYAMCLVNALEQSANPEVLKAAAKYLEILLQTEVTCMRASFDKLGESDFVKSVPYRSWTRAVARVHERAKAHLTGNDPVAKDTLRSLHEAHSAAEKLDRGIFIHTAATLLTTYLPERIAKPIKGVAHNLFNRVSVWEV